MPSHPFAPRFSPAALGATLLGVSAALLAIDVAGTFVLDERHAPLVAAESVPLAPPSARAIVAQGAPAGAAPRNAFAALVPQHAAVTRQRAPAPQPHAAVPAHVAAPARLPPIARAQPSNARSRQVAPTAVALTRPSARPVPLQRRPAVPVAGAHVAAAPVAPLVATVTPSGTSNRAPRVREIASLRDVRRFVIRKLDAGGTRVCAISATAYTARDGHVIVDLVMRNRKARWTEKAVVRRNGTGLKLLGVKMRALPYRTLAANGIKPGQ